MSLLTPITNKLSAKARPRAATEKRQQYVWGPGDDVTGWMWLWSNPWLADEGREDKWGLIRSCWKNSNSQKSSKPCRDPSQSVCQMRMKSAFAEATQCSYFNAIQFALTAPDTKWVIILHCRFFLKQDLCKLFLHSPEPVLHKQRATKTSEDAGCKEDVSETERRTRLNTGSGEGSELECTPRALKVTAQTVCLSSLHPVLFHDIQNNISDQAFGCECESQADSIFNNRYALNYSTRGTQPQSKPDQTSILIWSPKTAHLLIFGIEAQQQLLTCWMWLPQAHLRN